MPPDSPSRPHSRSDRLARVTECYDTGRFVDAYMLTREQWQRDPRTVTELDVEETVLASRLAARLGSGRFSRALLRHAAKRWPDDPQVRYFSAFESRSLLQSIEAFERRPELPGAKPHTGIAWLCAHATAYAMVRDFDRAQELLTQAEDIDADDWFLAVDKSLVARLREQWDEALALAERAHALQPGHPASAGALASALVALGQPQRARARLVEIAARSQSFEIVAQAIALGLSEGVVGSATERERLGRVLLSEAQSLTRLAPLADRRHQQMFDSLRAHAALLTGDREQFDVVARRAGSAVLTRLADNLRRTEVPEHRVVLEHPKIQQRHDTCVPASVATCLRAMGETTDADALAQELSYGGTAEWRARRWATDSGYTVRCFTVDLASARALLDRGIPFMTIFSSEASGHACAAVGLDVRAGTLLLHDPANASPGQCLIEPVAEAHAPVGPLGMAIVPREKAAALRGLVLPDEAAQTHRIQVEEALAEHETQRAAALLDAVDPAIAEHPLVEYTRALVVSHQGHNRRALARFERLLERFPMSRRLQGAVELEATRTRNAAVRQRVLRTILSGSDDPLHDPVQALRGASPVFVSRYAQLLARTATRRDEAERLLAETLRDAPQEAELYHVLAELLWDSGRKEEALLPYRIASCLAPTNDSAASAYAWALARLDRDAQAVQWLRRRIDTLSSAAATAGPVLSTAELLLDLGDPGSAVDLVQHARLGRPKHGELAAGAAPILARIGYQHEADDARRAAASYGTPLELASCDTMLARLRGDLDGAREHAEHWLSLAPHSTQARSVVLTLQEAREGSEAATERARAWALEAEGDETIDLLLVDRLGRHGNTQEQEARLRVILERDPNNAWARRELAGVVLARVQRLAQPQPSDLAPLAELVDRCIADAPNTAAALGLEAELLLLQGQHEEALVGFERACFEDPLYGFGLRRRIELSALAGKDAGARLLDFLDRLVASARTHDLSVIAPALVGVARIVGLHAAREAIERWEPLAPGDPHLLEAAIDLQMDDASRDALTELVPRLRRAVARHPYHEGLRLSLAWLLDRLDRPQAARSEYESLCQDFPGGASLRSALALFLRRRGEATAAAAALDEAIALAPHTVDFRVAKVRWLREEGRAAEALEALQPALKIDPHGTLGLWLQLLADLDRWAEVAEHCEQVIVQPDVRPANLMLVARVLSLPAVGGRADRARQLRQRAVELAPGNWDLVSEYCESLRASGEFDEATRAATAYLGVATDTVCARGELALIEYERGNEANAIKQLQALVEQRPDYQFGWNTLAAWLEHASQWQRLLAVLDSMPDFMRCTPEVQLRRVRLLPRTKAPATEIRDAIASLLLAHPHSIAVRDYVCNWYLRREELDAAEQALLGVKGDDSTLDPPLLARKVALRAAQGRPAEALDCAQSMWRLGNPLGAADSAKAIEALKKAGLLVEATVRLRVDWSEGNPVSLDFTEQLVIRLGEHPLPVELEALGHVLRGRPGHIAREALARVVEALSDLERYELLESMLREDFNAVRQDRSLWPAVGHMYLGRDEPELAHAWLGNWREMDETPMYALANFSSAALRLGHIDDAIEASVFALENRVPDAGYPYLIRALYAGLLLAGHTEQFAAALPRYGQAEGDSTRAQALRLFASLLGEELSEKEIEVRARMFATLELTAWDKGLRKRWAELLRTRLSGWVRAKLAMGRALDWVLKA